MVIGQIAGLRSRGGEEAGLPDAALQMYYDMLDRLYEQDLRLAQVKDRSDLLLRVEGEAFNADPRLQLVSTVFSNVTHQVTDLTKAILGFAAKGRVTPGAIDLGLTGIAPGSLYIGLKAVVGVTADGGALLGEADTLYKSTKHALKIIVDVAHTVEGDSEHVSMEDVSEVVSDPRIRDAALVAVQRISPSGRKGFDTVSVSGMQSSSKPAELRSTHRTAIRNSLSKPVIRGDEIEFSGQVREIDLDARRFELRGITNTEIQDLRCAYRDFDGVKPRSLLGATVKVRGLVERAADEIPRLMSITDLQVLKAPPDDLG
jgi:hypothetical protein